MMNNIVNTYELVELKQHELISINGGNWWSDLKAGFVSAFSGVWDNLVTYLTIE